ncbi:hypothetical protein PILCRDRAFT_98523 [Piloderma croceum F 1598]|uniref:Chromate transporter n=1 Tax=Piloderma croceum (strain F 1598) TaxID=765440 RepID=A0A0C3FDI7_PILCF|nr:hypothetical protein PILCRDRAFT_98523 [Piloderma croceum F 1598]
MTPFQAITPSSHRTLLIRLVETARAYWHLGFTAFGGPGVHVIILRRKFVDRLKWLDTATFNDLFTLGNALPGPGSTQLAFSIALVRNGTLAALLAFIMWSFPGAIGMAVLGVGVRSIPNNIPDIALAVLTGLNAATVGLIALAAFNLSKSTITDKITRFVLFASAAFGICYHAPWMYPTLMAVGGITTLAWDNRHRLIAPVISLLPSKRSPSARGDNVQAHPDLPVQEDPEAIELSDRPARSPSIEKSVDEVHVSVSTGVMSEAPRNTAEGPSSHLSRVASSSPASLSGVRQRPVQSSSSPAEPERPDISEETPLLTLGTKQALGMVVVFVAILITFIVMKSTVNTLGRPFDFFVNMIIAGIIIFGGGPVVIPLLRGYTVSSRDFLLGYAILQAFPGPNFNFAVYLGILAVPSNPALGAFLGFLGIFSPGIVLKLALLPLYKTWRSHSIAKSILRGLNAAAVGLVYTAVWQLFLVGYIYTPASGAAASTTINGPLTADPWWGVIAAGAFSVTEWFGSPPPFTIVLGALGGLGWFGVVHR